MRNARNLISLALVCAMLLFGGPAAQSWAAVLVGPQLDRDLPDRFYFDGGEDLYWLDLSELKRSDREFSVRLYRSVFADSSWEPDWKRDFSPEQLRARGARPGRRVDRVVQQEELSTWTFSLRGEQITSTLRVGLDTLRVTLANAHASEVDVDINGMSVVVSLNSLISGVDEQLVDAFVDLDRFMRAVLAMERASELLDQPGEVVTTLDDSTCSIACMTCLWSGGGYVAAGITLALAGCGGGWMCVAFLIGRTANMGASAASCGFCLSCLTGGGPGAGDDDGEDEDCDPTVDPDGCECPTFAMCPGS